jgi:hypothetical protein
MQPYAERAAESKAVQKLDRGTPYVIKGVSRGQLSPCRYYGGCVFNGARYSYVPPTDELVRADVVKALAKEEKAVVKAANSGSCSPKIEEQLELIS